MRAYKPGEGEGREMEEVQERENEKDTHGERRAGGRASERERVKIWYDWKQTVSIT